MPPPSPKVAAEVQEWMRYARTDLRAASSLLDTPPDAQLISAYHAQQGAEKALKGFLLRHGVAFPFTHSISLLRELAEPHGAWVNALADADKLTEYATSARYPGIGKTLTPADARTLLLIATSVYEAAREALAADGISIEQAL